MQQYKTKDIFEAAWLYSQDTPLEGMDKDSSYYWFIFDSSNLTENLPEKYWKQTATGNIKRFVDSYKTLKDLLYSQKSGT